MYVEVGPGEALHVGLRESDGVFIVDYAKAQPGVLSITADMPDTTGREGVIYEEHFGDAPTNPDAQLLSAIAHGRDEDVEGRVIPLSIMRRDPEVVPVADIEREREERFAIADMLRAATTRKAVETAFDRLRHHLDVHLAG